MNSAELTTFAVGMLAVTNPIGNLAIFAGLTAERSDAERRAAAVSCAVAVLVIFLTVTWAGSLILKAFGITIAAFEGAGGLILLLLGLAMLHSQTSAMHHTAAEAAEAQTKESIGVVPMAIPIVAGPGALTTIIIQGTKHPGIASRVEMSLVGLGISAVILVAFLGSSMISRWLGSAGINIVTRIMGIILAAIGVDMIGGAARGFLTGQT
jgi:multiple antibiotic resistance protein